MGKRYIWIIELINPTAKVEVTYTEKVENQHELSNNHLVAQLLNQIIYLES